MCVVFSRHHRCSMSDVDVPCIYGIVDALKSYYHYVDGMTRDTRHKKAETRLGIFGVTVGVFVA